MTLILDQGRPWHVRKKPPHLNISSTKSKNTSSDIRAFVHFDQDHFGVNETNLSPTKALISLFKKIYWSIKIYFSVSAEHIEDNVKKNKQVNSVNISCSTSNVFGMLMEQLKKTGCRSLIGAKQWTMRCKFVHHTAQLSNGSWIINREMQNCKLELHSCTVHCFLCWSQPSKKKTRSERRYFWMYFIFV